jgi:hypothetical protein
MELGSVFVLSLFNFEIMRPKSFTINLSLHNKPNLRSIKGFVPAVGFPINKLSTVNKVVGNFGA